MSDDELLAALREALADAQANAARYQAAIEALAPTVEVEGPALRPLRSAQRAAPAKRSRSARSVEPAAPRQSKYDYVEVARIATEARAAGKHMGPAVQRPGAWLIAEAQRQGHLAKSTPAKQAPAKQPKWDYAEVARVAASAQHDGEPVRETVATAFDVSLSMAGALIAEARQRGHGVDVPIGDAPPAPAAAWTPDDAREVLEARQ